MTTKGFLTSCGPFLEDIYYLIDDNGKPYLNKKGKKIRVRISSEEIAADRVSTQYVCNGYLSTAHRKNLVKVLIGL